MYSLYRAWLTLGSYNNLPPLSSIPSLLPPPAPSGALHLSRPNALSDVPDVVLQVGPSLTQFSAHKSVLSTHSGFFKAALLNHSGITPISVPNVNIDEFSSLLTFMYTGHLDLNISNIYNILLATHILHMPRALEICRSYLLQSQPQETPTNLIKPIASKKAVLPTQQIYPPTFSTLQQSEDTPFKIVRTTTCDTQKASTSKLEDEVVENDPKTSEEKTTLPQPKKSKKRSDSSDDKVIIDIACCDGPVRFHRVINKYYGVQESDTYKREEINRNAVLNKVMNENIRDKLSSENDANQSDLFTCLYCNHTFKSQYCYQKHARRHLNPVSLEAKPQLKENKREVKLLDMNVQYYPCKTCGSKFPSYYFVHKHRKLCHAEEMADNTNKNNEIVAENVNSSIIDTNSSSAIDVEAVNTDIS